MKIKMVLLTLVSFVVIACGDSGSANDYTRQNPLIAVGSPTPAGPLAPLALIYKGLGSCSAAEGDAGIHGYGCSEAASDAATAAGFQYKFVGPTDLPENASPAQVSALFSNAKVWIQPGGVSNEGYSAMTAKLKSEIVNFVFHGGGYVGICAGAFLATDWIYIFPGLSSLYDYETVRDDLGYGLLNVTWSGKKRVIYFEGGPYFYNLAPTVEVMATFDDSGDAAAVRAPYGSGRVYLSGPHPEAPQIWSQEDGITDPDGSDLDLAAGMISWAAGITF